MLSVTREKSPFPVELGVPLRLTFFASAAYDAAAFVI
jgi:hypothetical protein